MSETSANTSEMCLACGIYQHENHKPDQCANEPRKHQWDQITCIESGDGSGCSGPVEYRFGYGLKGSYVRCYGHWDKYMERMEGVNRRYPDSPLPPGRL